MAQGARALLKSAGGEALARIVRRLRAPLLGSYERHVDAAKACKPIGYEAPEVTTLVREKTRQYAARLEEMDLPLPLSETDVTMLLAARMAGQGRALRVVDFGGGCGAHFFLCRRLWGDSVALDWTVVETSAMANAARLNGFIKPNFVDDLASLSAAQPDFVLASGSLPYAADPLATARALAALSARVVCVMRTSAVSLQQPLFVVERSPLRFHGPGVSRGAPNKTVHTAFALIPERALVGCFSTQYDLVLARDEQFSLFHERVGMFRLRSYVFLRRAAIDQAEGFDSLASSRAI